jgi:hypothetical protein
MSLIRERFWQKVDLRGEDDCWNWLGGKSGEHGYGRFSILTDGHWISHGSHRLSYEWAYGVAPRKLHVLHRCDNPACVNPKHLFLGKPIDNIRDCISKGRFPRGETQKSTLFEEDVARIKEMVLFGAIQRDVAKVFDVSPALVCTIVKRKRWAHLGA